MGSPGEDVLDGGDRTRDRIDDGCTRKMQVRECLMCRGSWVQMGGIKKSLGRTFDSQAKLSGLSTHRWGKSIRQSIEVVSWGHRWLETKEAAWALHGICRSFLLFKCGDRSW